MKFDVNSKKNGSITPCHQFISIFSIVLLFTSTTNWTKSITFLRTKFLTFISKREASEAWALYNSIELAAGNTICVHTKPRLQFLYD